QVPPDYPVPFLENDALMTDFTARQVLYLNNTGIVPLAAQDDSDSVDDSSEDAGARLFSPGGRFGGELRPVLSFARERRTQGDSVVVVSLQVDRLADVWAQEASGYLPKLDEMNDTPPPGTLAVVNGSLGEGWTLHTDNGALHLLTDAEIFNW